MKYQIRILVSNGKHIDLELDEQYAPITVKNFIKLVKENFFDGTIFHRVIKDFMIQTGGYKIIDNSLTEVNSESIKGEFKQNGFDNPLKHTLGVISMARTSDPNSGSNQFFICAADCPWLDGAYAAFGKTMDEESNKVVLEIDNVETCSPHPAFGDFPVETIFIEHIELLKEE